MATRKIKDAKDLTTNELVYFRNHAKATYMSDGTTVEDKINSISSSGGDVDLSKYVQKTELSSVATSGNYNDLSNKPTIPSAVTESTVSGWGFTKNAGTVTGVKANGTAITLSSGVANIPAASTSAYGVTKLSSATNSTSTTLAATPSAVKAAYDLANNYKGTVTGVKINGTTKSPTSGVVDLGTFITAHQTLKTINGESIVGSGNITIEGGSSSGSVVSVVEEGQHIEALQPNVITIITPEIQSLYIEDFVTSSSKHDEYTIIFYTSITEPEPPHLTLPDYVRWANGSIPTLEWNTVYEFSITRDFLKFIPEGQFNRVEQSIYKAVLTPFKPVE